LACGGEKPVDGLLDAAHRLDEDGEQAGHGQRGHEPDHECDGPVRVGRSCDHGHLPTATFLSAHAAWSIRTPESLIRAIPGSSAVWSRTAGRAPSAVFACSAMRRASNTIVI